MNCEEAASEIASILVRLSEEDALETRRLVREILRVTRRIRREGGPIIPNWKVRPAASMWRVAEGVAELKCSRPKKGGPVFGNKPWTVGLRIK